MSRAYIMAFITVIVWGTAFTAIRASLHGGYSPGHLMLLRHVIASAAFILYAMWPGVKFKLPKRQDLLKILILGWIGISVYHLGVGYGEVTISAGTAGLLIGSSPIFTAIIAVIFSKERLDRNGWVGLFIGFVGIALITVGSSGSSFEISTGALLLIMAAIATSIYFVFQKPLFKRYSPIEVTAYVTWAGTLPFFFYMPGIIDTIQQATLEANLSVIFLGIFPSAIGYVTWTIALSLGKASSISSILYIEPIIAIIVSWLWLQEVPSSLALLGGMISILGVLVVNGLIKRKKKKPVSIVT
ncbi:DMT family transporter [Niallia sp. Krafla_26]|uniref:DMT family transporter n=1 Tax=Niallia sp. Krafla_26 TaxID=3064703 RepID=UPI003D166AF0